MSSRLAAVLDGTRTRAKARDVSDWAEKERILLDACHPKQRAFVLDPGRRVVALTGRGCGKTTGDRARLMRRMMRTPNAKCLFIAQTRDQAIELMWSPLKDLIEKLGIDVRLNETSLRCTFVRNKAQLRLVGADDKKQIEKLRGQPFHEVIVDEAASFPTQLLEHLLSRIIGPRLGDYGGVLVVNGTPGHILSGPFYDATRPGSDISRRWDDRDLPEFANWQRWSMHSWSLRDGAPFVPALARLWDEALREKEANGWGDNHPVWLREYLGQWAADDTEHVLRFRSHLDDGQEWNQWSPERDPRTGIAKLPAEFTDWCHVIGLDMGHADPFALCLLAWSPSDLSKTLYHRWEYSKKGMYAKPIAELLIGPELNADKPAGLIGEIGWPDAIVADTAGYGTAILAEMADVYGIKIAAAEKKDRFDAVELSNGDLVDGRIKILDGSVLKEQAMHLQWAVDEFGKMSKHKGQRDDMVDAFVYARRAAQHLLSREAPEVERRALSEFQRVAEAEEPVDGERDQFGDLLYSSDNYDDADFFG